MSAFSSEIIITLQQLKGVGKKTILALAEMASYDISDVETLCKFWSSLKGKKFECFDADDIRVAHSAARRILRMCADHGVGVLSCFDEDFPHILKSCITENGNEDPVLLLYYRGSLAAFEKPGLAIIGTREPTPNGVKAGEYFSSEFAKENFNVVSGLAIGCDSAAHRGALKVGGTTTAFLANGLDWDSIYPKENLDLAKEIVDKGGLLLSEYPVGQSCDRYALVARDRLQAALSYGTIVIQTGERGGTMHAVGATNMSGKPLFAVEYKDVEDNTHEKVQGNIMLIREDKAAALRSDNIQAVIKDVDFYIVKSHTESTPKSTLF